MSKFSDRERFRRDHRWAPRRMSDYLDGELAGDDRDRMRLHLGECDACRRLLGSLRAIVAGLHRLPAPSGGVDAVQIAAAVRLRSNEPPPAG